MMMLARLFLTLVALSQPSWTGVKAFSLVAIPKTPRRAAIVPPLRASNDNDDDTNEQEKKSSSSSEADFLRKRAEELRSQIRSMEEELGSQPRRPQQVPPPAAPQTMAVQDEGMTLRGKKILVAGANGRLGSMVCRYLLRNHPQTEVIAVVHVVGENSDTSRGYGRLSYEVGAEDGVGSITPAWQSSYDEETEERGWSTTSFQWDESMRDYNLQNLRVMECEFLDPVQCQTICTESKCDAVIWCATDFNGNKPRAISGLNVAFLFRAVARPDKGRVEIEGLQNMLGALKQARQDRQRSSTITGQQQQQSISSNDPINFVLVSTDPDAFEDFETPFGSFIGIKRQAEQMMLNDFPSLTSVALQMGRYDDNFVEEDLDIILQKQEESSSKSGDSDDNDDEGNKKRQQKQKQKLINRRDAARAAVNALTDETLVGKTVQVWTASR